MRRKQPAPCGLAACGTAAKRWTIWLLLCVLNAATMPARAQRPTRLDLGGGFVQVGGEAERYLRVLQVAGMVPLSSWAIQPFSMTQANALRPGRPHPWASRFDSVGAVGSRVLRPKLRTIGNSSFPYQISGGPTWAGRGLTGELEAGVAAWWRGVYFQAAPLAFAAQNSGFSLAANGASGNGAFGDARFPANIDAPQRFGSGPYSSVRGGTSILSYDVVGVTMAATTAAQRWGPAFEYPLVLGPNAGGFPSVFLGTSVPVDLWLFKIHGRLTYGQLEQSSFAPPIAGERRRLASGVVGTVLPRGAPGLELGGSRFIHSPWSSDAVSFSTFRRPVSGGLNVFGVATNELLENQIASVFARWALPAAKAEFYGELYREDYPGKFHEALSLVEKPDDLAAFTLGFQRVLTANDRQIRVIRAEVVNGETSHQERDTRGFVIPLPPYVHSGVTQGHTLNGLMLGSPEAYGGAGWRIGFDEYTTTGRWSVAIERSLRGDWLPTVATGAEIHPDVLYAVRGELLRFRGGADYSVVLIPSVNLNRDLVASRDVWNVAIGATVRGWP